MNPDNAADIYQQVLLKINYTAQVKAWAEAYSKMDAKSAAKIMYADASADVLDEKAREYEALQSNVENAARRGYIDLIINPADTRKYLIAGFEMLFTKKVEGPMKKHGAK